MLHALLLCLLLMPDATALWQAGRREEALAARQQELIARPGDAALRLECARWQLDVHRAQAALATLQELGKEADSLRGEAYYKLAQYEPAVRLLDSSGPEGLLRKLDALEALMRFEESDALLSSAPRTLWDSDARVWSAEGRRLARQREYPRAIEAFERALRIDPAEGEAMFGLGRAQIAAGEREKGLATLVRHRELLPKLDAWDFARRAVDLAPRHAANLAALADAERDLSRLERAEALYLTALGCAQSTEERVPVALRFARYWSESRRDAPRALMLLQEIVKSNPDARLWVRAGDLAVELKRTDDALRCYREALRLRPQDEAIRTRIERLEERR